MSLSDDLLKPVSCKAADVSPIYNEILSHVAMQFSAKPAETRTVVFAVAYLMYSREKKSFVGPATRLSGSDISQFIDLSRTKIPDNCERAFQVFDQLQKSTWSESLSEVSSIMDAKFVAINGTVSRLDSSISALDSKFRLDKRSLFRRIVSSILTFLLIDSFKHFVILFVAVFGWALGLLFVIDHVVPPLRSAIATYYDEEIASLMHRDNGDLLKDKR